MYDGDLQMFVQTKREPNRETLDFLRWLAENDRLEHAIAGPPAGDYAIEPTVATAEQTSSNPVAVQPTPPAKRASWYAGSGE